MMFNDKLQADSSFGDAMGVISKYSLLVPVRTQNPPKVWGVFSVARIGIFGPPECIQMDEEGAWKNDI